MFLDLWQGVETFWYYLLNFLFYKFLFCYLIDCIYIYIYIFVRYFFVAQVYTYSIRQNFPREYTRNCLKKAHTTIYLVDSSSGRVFRSPIFTSSKHDEDKFIYSGWIRFVKANSLRFKDKVVLNAKHGNNVLDVHIIRGSQSS
jgi:hypothetical protein